MKPTRIALTLGDPAGVGPEIIAAAWPQLVELPGVLPLVIGHPELMRRACDLRGVSVDVTSIDAAPVDAAPVDGLDRLPVGAMPCLWRAGDAVLDIQPGRQSPAAGQAAYEGVTLAARLALAGEIDAITTGPLNKASLHAAGHYYPGHTELLAEMCGVEKFAMMLHLPRGDRVCGRVGMNVVHVMLHTSMRNALDGLTIRGIVEAGELIDGFTAQLLRARNISSSPRIAVCALNPHAGEQSAFGDEETTLIEPAVEELRAKNIDASGPYPVDTLMARVADGEFDGVVAMYHDQGHIAVKLLDMHRAVNVTLGLPIVRTSVAHGTAFDKAWHGTARADGLVRAVELAALLAQS
jgi:4-hydroxythreonine-4-phosphate dehydrogenase